jgi:2-methylcitrate dehydratase
MRRAIFAANCVRAGMRGAPQPFEGLGGFWEKISGPFELTLPAIPDGPMVVEMSYLKRYPTEAHTQALIGFVLSKVRSWTTADEIESFDIETYWHARDSTGLREKGTWDPQSRETAHHSLPYTLSVALVDGEVALRSSFTTERITDPALRPIMEKFTIRENDEFTANYRPPGMEVIGNPCYRVSIRKKTGEEFHEDVTFPKGHMKNPMTVEDINAKLDDACTGVIDDEHKEEIRTAWWNFEKAASVADVIGTLRNFK